MSVIPSSGFGFSLTNPVMGGFQGTSITALPSATDEGWNSQKRPYGTLAKQRCFVSDFYDILDVYKHMQCSDIYISIGYTMGMGGFSDLHT